ncbi:MAG: family 20 glycosylhydrolase [Candidatus Brockarchaeota archaeon]|nr:family 20 glycosylhydrolase [Candidatus Brockarchaeota archaeon]
MERRLWRGIHLISNSNDDIDALVKEVPELTNIGVNVLIVEVDYSYAYSSHPELQGPDPITFNHARALVEECRSHDIRLIPQFQCLGHQSWGKTTFPLLTKYPEFDETPGQFPNNEGIYCRSWCPQHPDVNRIVFSLFDELIDVFEADALHVGMDEVFLIASEHCPRCRNQSPSRLFAKAANDYYEHLKKRGVEMLMWGDRLLDSKTTGYGMWEASENQTHPAVDMIPRDIVICDWHYTLREDYPSIPFFLEKGFRVLPSGWKDVEATKAFIGFSRRFMGNERMLGYLCTTWGAVKPGSLAQWPPIRFAMEMLSQ